MNNVKLAVKIGLGFGVLILFTILVSLFSWRGLATMDEGAAEYQRIAKNSNIVGEIQTNMLRMQMAVKDFLLSGSETAVSQYQEHQAKIANSLAAAHQSIADPEKAEQLNRVDENIKAYDQAFAKVMKFKGDRDLVVATLGTLGMDVEAILSDLMAKAARTGATSSGYKSGLSLRVLLLARLDLADYLSTSNQQAAEEVKVKMGEFQTSLKDLRGSLLRVEWQALVDDIEAKTATFLDQFTMLVAVTEARNAVSANELDNLGPAIATATEVIKDFYITDQEELGQNLGSTSRSAIITMLVVALLAVMVGVVVSVFLTRAITGPIRKTADFAAVMAGGDFSRKLNVEQKDEIGVMASSLNRMVEELGGMIREVVSGVETLSGSSSELTTVSSRLSEVAKDTSGKADSVAAAAEEMSTNIQSVSAAMEQSSANVGMVASATEEMTATVNEIAKNAEKARSITDRAVLQSRATSEKMASLGDSANKIGRVTETITEISEQTNLLALNATIEAARAGEAGKGFAVVANEIKELARQTSDATIDIKNQIGDMQQTTNATITDIGKISEIIEEINAMINTIATAVEEQSATTMEIAGNISQASQGIGEVNENVAQSTSVVSDITVEIAGINQQSTQVEEGSNQVQTSAKALSELSAQLKGLVSRFKTAA